MRYLLLATFCLSSLLQGAAVSRLFEHQHQTSLLMHIEAALAEAQAAHGIIPADAATEIRSKVDASLISEADLQAEYQVVRHRMVAFLNSWGKHMANGAEQYLHYGATTVDIYDTLMVLQLLDAIDAYLAKMRSIEQQLISMARQYKTTPMVGRTLGQHALPISFGKKLSGWLAENRRHIERLKTIRTQLRRSSIMKGAVGSYLGLGDKARIVEQDFARFLGLDAPYADDWHASRDVFADFALSLAMVSKSYGRWGQEIFLMQSTDLAEVVEVRSKSAVSSSSMPHKNNPSLSESLMHSSRTLPRLAEVILDDMVNFYERDNTSRPNRTLAELAVESDKLLNTSLRLLKRLKVNDQQMTDNLNKTQGLLTAQRLVLALAPEMGKQKANEHIHTLAKTAYDKDQLFVEALIADNAVRQILSVQQLRQLTDTSTYLGLDAEVVEAVIKQVQQAAATDPGPREHD